MLLMMMILGFGGSRWPKPSLCLARVCWLAQDYSYWRRGRLSCLLKLTGLNGIHCNLLVVGLKWSTRLQAFS